MKSNLSRRSNSSESDTDILNKGMRFYEDIMSEVSNLPEDIKVLKKTLAEMKLRLEHSEDSCRKKKQKNKDLKSEIDRLNQRIINCVRRMNGCPCGRDDHFRFECNETWPSEKRNDFLSGKWDKIANKKKEILLYLKTSYPEKMFIILKLL